MKSDLIKVTDVANMLHRSKATIHAWVNNGTIPDYARPFTLGPLQRGFYFSHKAIERWIKESKEANVVKPDSSKNKEA